MVKKLIDISQGFYRFRFLLHKYFFWFSLITTGLPCRLRKVYAVLRAVKRFVGSETPKQNAFDQFWKFEFHSENFLRNTRFLSFDGLSNYLYLFKNHQQRVSWPGELSSSHIKVTKVWFGSPNIKYLSEHFFADFCWRKGISWCLS